MQKIIQWNINGYYTHYEQLRIILKESNSKVLYIQERIFKRNHHTILRDYEIFAKNKENETYTNGKIVISHHGNTPSHQRRNNNNSHLFTKETTYL